MIEHRTGPARALRRACRLALAVLALSCLSPGGGWHSRAAQAAEAAKAAQTFPSADAAAAALAEAVRKDDIAALHAILGPGSDSLIESGDKVADVNSRHDFIESYDQKHALVADKLGRMVLQIGDNDWPLPLPIVQAGGQWHFDSQAGAQELVERRIGANEIAAIRTSLAYADAQHEYFSEVGADGAGEYAQRLVSSDGATDGLYWPQADGQPDSPLQPLVDQAKDEGYPGELVAGRMAPYQGYLFHILKGQGPNAPGGKLNYVVDGHMTKGFALVAWPARYGSSGIVTFVVNQDGIVYQKDLGPKTEQIASTMKLFDPDLSWARVDVVDDDAAAN